MSQGSTFATACRLQSPLSRVKKVWSSTYRADTFCLPTPVPLVPGTAAAARAQGFARFSRGLVLLARSGYAEVVWI